MKDRKAVFKAVVREAWLRAQQRLLEVPMRRAMPLPCMGEMEGDLTSYTDVT
jgi:hypothetical protein